MGATTWLCGKGKYLAKISIGLPLIYPRCPRQDRWWILLGPSCCFMLQVTMLDPIRQELVFCFRLLTRCSHIDVRATELMKIALLGPKENHFAFRGIYKPNLDMKKKN